MAKGTPIQRDIYRRLKLIKKHTKAGHIWSARYEALLMAAVIAAHQGVPSDMRWQPPEWVRRRTAPWTVPDERDGTTQKEKEGQPHGD